VQTTSYLDLFLSLFGWQWYDWFYDELNRWGLTYVPFIVFIVKNWVTPVMSNNSTIPPFLASLRRMEIDFYGALLVVTVAFVPAVPISAGAMTYTDASGATVTATNSGTTYDDSFANALPTDTVKVPILWHGLIQGVNMWDTFVRTKVKAPVDLRGLAQQVASLTIDDPALRAETARFQHWCYMPSLAKFQRSQDPAIQAKLAKYGNDDIDWVGSRAFLETPGYYAVCKTPDTCGAHAQPMEQLPGWSYDWQKPEQWGQPSCAEWWNDSTKGLRNKLLDTQGISEIKLSDSFNYLGAKLGSTEAEDRLIRSMLTTSPTNAFGHNRSTDGMTKPLWSTEGAYQWLKQGASEIASSAGAVLVGGAWHVIIHTLVQTLPMIQAYSLFATYMLLPIMIVISAYSPAAMFGFMFWIATLLGLSALWDVAAWADNNVMAALYPDAGSFIDGATNALKTGFTRDIMLSVVLGMGYVGIPVIWIILMGIAGVKSVNGLSDAMTQLGSNAAQKAGQQGMDTAKTVVTRGLG